MAKKVLYAKLHDGFFIPSLGNFKDTLPPDNKPLTGFKMTLQGSTSDYGPGSLLLEWIGAAGKPMAYVIGAATVKGAVVEADVETTRRPTEEG